MSYYAVMILGPESYQIKDIQIYTSTARILMGRSVSYLLLAALVACSLLQMTNALFNFDVYRLVGYEEGD